MFPFFFFFDKISYIQIFFFFADRGLLAELRQVYDWYIFLIEHIYRAVVESLYRAHSALILQMMTDDMVSRIRTSSQRAAVHT